MKIIWTQSGISLIELILAVVMVSILISVAYPSYIQHLYISRRSEACSELIQAANMQEHFFLQMQHYASLSELGLNTFQGNSYATKNNFYRITASVTPSSYLLTATAIGSQASDTECQTLTLAQDGSRDSTSHERCW